MSTGDALLTPAEAASVTGVPLRQVNRIIDAGLLDGAVERRNKARLVARGALVGLKLAHDTAELLSLEGRRTVVAALLRDPARFLVRANAVAVDARPAARAVRSGLDLLAKARRIVTSSADVLGGTPVLRGTRIPVHDVAEMLANGDGPAAILAAYPQLDARQLDLTCVYAAAYPRRGRPARQPAWHKSAPTSTRTLRIDDLPPAA